MSRADRSNSSFSSPATSGGPLRSESVIYEDNHLLVINKPAGIATMGAAAGEPTIHAMACAYLKRKYNKPGNVFVGIVSRLDAMTTGVLVLARTSKAASRLTRQFGASTDKEAGKKKSKQKASSPARKLYLVAVEGEWVDEGASDQRGGVSTLVDRIWKDDEAHRMRVDRGDRPDAQHAELRCVKLGQIRDSTLLAVQLVTGRKHQIRLQFADRGHPVLGDRKYGARSVFEPGVALHSWQLLISHPTQDQPLRFEADPPASWRAFAGIVHAPETLRSIAATLAWSFDSSAATSTRE